MARKKTNRSMLHTFEVEFGYVLKLLAYLALGSIWLRITTESGSTFPLPVGFVAGVAISMHERLQIDRKIEYAVLTVSMFVGFWLPVGLELAL